MTDAFLAVMGAATRIQVMTRHSPVVAETRTAVEAANTEGHLRRARLREAGVRLAKPNAPRAPGGRPGFSSNRCGRGSVRAGRGRGPGSGAPRAEGWVCPSKVARVANEGRQRPTPVE